MKHLFILLLSFTALAGTATAQKSSTVQKAIQNPQRDAESGKADVFIHHKRQVSDATPKSKSGAVVTEKKRKRICGTGVKPHSKS